MVVHFRVAIHTVVPGNGKSCSDVAVEFTSACDFRNQDDYVLAGGGFIDLVQDFIRRISQKAAAILRTQP